jgi:hypothetical protein
MILLDLNESYKNIPKSHHIARKKVPLLWGQKSCFYFLHQKGTQVKANRVRKTYVLHIVKSYQNHPHMTLHDLSFVKIWGVKKLIFSNFGYFKGLTGSIFNGIKRLCVYYDRGSQEQS